MKLREPLPRRKDMRLGHHDYSSPAHYFITTVTRERREILSSIIDDRVVLTGLGEILDREWRRLPERFPCVRLGVHVVMPNHLHAILELVEDAGVVQPSRPTLGVVVGTLKAMSMLRARESGAFRGPTMWQRGYFDRVIRDGLEHEALARYIEANPFKWPQDPLHPTGGRGGAVGARRPYPPAPE